MAIVTELKFGFEGYAPIEEGKEFQSPMAGVTFYGYAPVNDMFSVVYRDMEQQENKESTFCFFIDKADAVALEYVLQREIAERSMRSETFFTQTVFMTCFAGSMPIISFPRRGFSFRYRYDKDYDNLLKMLTEFLDTTNLDDELKKLRAELNQELKSLSSNRPSFLR